MQRPFGNICGRPAAQMRAQRAACHATHAEDDAVTAQLQRTVANVQGAGAGYRYKAAATSVTMRCVVESKAPSDTRYENIPPSETGRDSIARYSRGWGAIVRDDIADARQQFEAKKHVHLTASARTAWPVVVRLALRSYS
jgi:hypothetical protein